MLCLGQQESSKSGLEVLSRDVIRQPPWALGEVQGGAGVGGYWREGLRDVIFFFFPPQNAASVRRTQFSRAPALWRALVDSDARLFSGAALFHYISLPAPPSNPRRPSRIGALDVIDTMKLPP